MWSLRQFDGERFGLVRLETRAAGHRHTLDARRGCLGTGPARGGDGAVFGADVLVHSVNGLYLALIQVVGDAQKRDPEFVGHTQNYTVLTVKCQHLARTDPVA
jgi:alkyl hydroperoxide reductase subunit AhpF